MTYERFLEYVSEAMERHISRDRDTIPVDQEWETGKFADRLAHHLRTEGCRIDFPAPPPRARDLSEFEGM